MHMKQPIKRERERGEESLEIIERESILLPHVGWAHLPPHQADTWSSSRLTSSGYNTIIVFGWESIWLGEYLVGRVFGWESIWFSLV